MLRKLSYPNSALVDSCLDTTLMRELDEELSGLRHGEHYTFERWQRLPPYRGLAGVGNRHAYTEYVFQLYSVKLNPSGEVHLLDAEAASPNLTWFSIADLSAPRRADGASAYVDVLHAAWGQDIANQLNSVPDSGAIPLAVTDKLQMLDLPAAPAALWRMGKTGKERPVTINLDRDEWQLLMLLGWHARGFTIRAEDGVHLLGGGWVRFDSEVACKIGRSLFEKTRKRELPLVETHDGRYLRLSIASGILMFGPALFSYAIEGDDRAGGVLRVRRNALPTSWGELAGEEACMEVKGNTLRILRALAHGEDPTGRDDLLAGDWERNLREQLSPELQRLGLRKLWTTENKSASFVEGIRPVAPT